MMKDQIFHDLELIEAILGTSKAGLDRQQDFVVRGKLIVNRQPRWAKWIMKKQQRRPLAAAIQPRLSSAHCQSFFFTSRHYAFFALRGCRYDYFVIPVKTGIQVLSWNRKTQTWIPASAGMTYFQLIRHSWTSDRVSSTLMPRNFGMTFSANSRMLFSVYSRGALPTEKLAISKPKPTL